MPVFKGSANPNSQSARATPSRPAYDYRRQPRTGRYRPSVKPPAPRLVATPLQEQAVKTFGRRASFVVRNAATPIRVGEAALQVWKLGAALRQYNNPGVSNTTYPMVFQGYTAVCGTATGSAFPNAFPCGWLGLVLVLGPAATPIGVAPSYRPSFISYETYVQPYSPNPSLSEWIHNGQFQRTGGGLALHRPRTYSRPLETPVYPWVWPWVPYYTPYVPVTPVPYVSLPYLNVNAEGWPEGPHGSQPSAPTNPVAPPNYPQPPGGGTKERKVKTSFSGGAMGALLNGVTESLDVLDALWMALPYKVRRAAFVANGYPKGGLTPQVKAIWLYRNIKSLDSVKALTNLTINQIIDFAAGTAGSKASQFLGSQGVFLPGTHLGGLGSK